ncbi:Signal transduction histidine kinase [Marinospirillum celere]|uniref:histidine kinase n=1 Tax=Marinospirillum celere TaxID=1122252 RepID=A0A1I1GP80_9GAMM|nr:hybrid sensor histidine kinase/response regulator [Marinospirillum celere]SFC13306.1 Signal transduction histidine kinase [Marinospirillum celere]
MPANESDQLHQLQEENLRLQKINQALIERVEAGSSLSEAPYAAFEHAAALAEQVRERTSELTQLNAQLHLEISERKAMEKSLLEAKQEAEAANLSKSKFLAAVSHDLLQPLNAARLFTSALEEKQLSSEIQQLVTSASRSLNDVESLLRTLVDISKLDAGAVQPDKARFCLADLLNNLGSEYQQVAASKGLTLSWVTTQAWVETDQHLLARILRNFLANGLRYTPAGGRLLLGCRRQGASLLIQVWDTGLGIPENRLDDIFDEFQRVQVEPANGKDQGLGLGLAIVDKMARMLGHPIKVASRLGRGSMFSVQVPLAEGVERAQPSNEAFQIKQQRLQGAKVWVLDNDAAICEGMQKLLESWGCQVTTATLAEQLEEELASQKEGPQLLIVDYHLDTEVSGLDVAALLAGRLPRELAVLVITANHSHQLKAEVKRQGYQLLYKPVRPLRLRQALNQLLG